MLQIYIISDVSLQHFDQGIKNVIHIYDPCGALGAAAAVSATAAAAAALHWQQKRQGEGQSIAAGPRSQGGVYH